ncbi:MAG: aromatic ring-hydroxylating oxygenase subunit alpha [Myxococcota bacterium]
MFRAAWLAVTRERHIRRPGDYVVVEEEGLPPIIVIRDADGTIRAFVNSCRHRGTKLLARCGSVGSIDCPYHGWRYGLDGRLEDVPGCEGFARLPRERLGLQALAVETWAGLIWVHAGREPPPLRETLGGLDRELAPYDLAEMTPIQERIWTLPCNWKAVLDNATESYHLPAVHAASLGGHVSSTPEFRTYGDHARLTLPVADYGWRRWLDDATSRRGPYTDEQKRSIHKYLIFPNLLLNVLPYHLTIFQTWPLGPDRCRFFYGFYQRRGARGLEWLRAHATWLASRWILREDKRILERFQDGVRAGAGRLHHFHEQEVAIAHFHQVLSRRVAEQEAGSARG